MRDRREQYLDSWQVRRLMSEWRKVRSLVLVAEGKEDREWLWDIFVSLRPLILSAFWSLEEAKDDEPILILLTGWAFSSSLWACQLGRKEEEDLWLALGWLFIYLDQHRLVHMRGSVV